MKKYGNEFLKQNKDSFVGASSWIDFVADRMSELGYVEAKPTIKFGHFGSYILGDEENKDCDNGFKKLVGKKLFDKAASQNKIIKDVMDKDLREKFPEIFEQTKTE